VLTSREGQFTLDVTADDGEAVVQSVSSDLFTGVSVEELSALSSFTPLNVDTNDNSRITTLYISDAQLLSMLRPITTAAEVENAEDIVFAGVHFDGGAQFAKFMIGEVGYYLDFEGDVSAVLIDGLGVAAPSVTVDGLTWVSNSEDGETGYYVEIEQLPSLSDETPRYSHDLPLVINTYDPQVISASLTSLDQILLPLKPDADARLFAINKISDKAGNVAFTSGFVSGETGSDTLKLDVTDASIIAPIDLLSDTGVAGDRVTNDIKPKLSFVVDEEIQAARLVHLDPLASSAELVQRVDLTITETSALAYSAEASSDLAHGLWGVEVQDLAGNWSEVGGSAADYWPNIDISAEIEPVFIVDTIAPEAALIEFVEPLDDTGLSDGLVNASDLAGGSVELVIDPREDDHKVGSPKVSEIESVTIDGTIEVLEVGGRYFIDDALALSEGTADVAVVTRDAAGNRTTTNFNFDVDTVAPEAPKITLPGAIVEAGIGFAGDRILNLAEITSDGTTPQALEIGIELPPNDTTHLVSVHVDETEIPLDALTLNVLDLGLAEGVHTLSVLIRDDAGNTTLREEDFTVDTVMPDEPIFLIERENGGLDFWEAQQGLRATVTPTGAGDIVLDVSFNGVSMGPPDAQGFYEFSVPSDLTAATYDVVARMQDASGNEKDYTTTVDLTLDATPVFSVLPTLTWDGVGDYFVTFDIYLNTSEGDFTSARSLDFGLALPDAGFTYISHDFSSSFDGSYYHEFNDADPAQMWLSATATSGFAPAVGSYDEPLISVRARVDGAIKSANDAGTIELNNINVDEVFIADFTQTVDLSDLVPSLDTL